MNFGRSLRGQPEQFGDHRQRQFARITIDQIARASLGEQLVGELITDRLDVRLHPEHGTAAKRLVDDVAQSLVAGIVHRQHAVGERADHPRHPPPQSGDRAVVLADRERFGVLQHPVRQRLRRCGPDLADDRKMHPHHRPLRAQPIERGGGIAKVVLAGEIGLKAHARFPGEGRSDLAIGGVEQLRRMQVAIVAAVMASGVLAASLRA